MKTIKILIADNLEIYRSSVVDFLQLKGFEILTASTIDQARSILEAGEVDIALIDIRMVDDEDQTDISGLELAIKTAPHIPKIINTAYPSFESVRLAMRRIGGQLPGVLDFIDKTEGLNTLLLAIEKILPLRDIFVVHGHDDASLFKVKEFLTILHINPIILAEQPNDGQTILEKFERSSGSNYAIMLYTPDDQCTLKNESDKLEARARQNVILETGYFMGKLGRDRLCILYKEGVVLPSDIHGLAWIKLDPDGAWKLALARELRHAGFNINLNYLI